MRTVFSALSEDRAAHLFGRSVQQLVLPLFSALLNVFDGLFLLLFLFLQLLVDCLELCIQLGLFGLGCFELFLGLFSGLRDFLLSLEQSILGFLLGALFGFDVGLEGGSSFLLVFNLVSEFLFAFMTVR